ncbi:hypothetical protein P692DRAFT_20447495 [Suillus brevipes Sb2]|nr:hypothetical protein P692DRAFT_20447495 [Suillus brevipes Sb2]
MRSDISNEDCKETAGFYALNMVILRSSLRMCLQKDVYLQCQRIANQGHVWATNTKLLNIRVSE